MIDNLLLQNGFLVYLGLFMLLLGGAVGLPIPEDIPLILGGIVAHRHQGKITVIFVVCYSAIIIGDILIYYAGRLFGAALFNKKWLRSKFPPARLEQIKHQLEKRSLLMIFIARHLFYVRTATFLTCGAVKMKFSRFLLADLAAACISVPVMLGLGYIFAENFDSIIESIKQAKFFTGIVLLVVLGWYLLMVLRRRPGEAGQSEE